ncbi:DUF4369 domain-containing protein [Subsaxibacter sp. CAU 1640]|uniref:DUF4369 domain-containing protein n=1 Tax=Subsaxibacter sp. CAU 1640 TaxID=2933271 RepID=UPI00200680C3|nr:DUF4369 domain-containing protein [Subsaxibacter sp. CAU 1640]MCK7590028.1 DUF4369 domain-containing protein [Subsaxibacter sp. CAU 1640]
MKKISALLALILMLSCAEDKLNFVLKGNIKDLMKGTVYLQKLNDTTLVTIDSLVINGNPEFELGTELESPEVLYLKLHKNDNEEHIIPFFAAEGITEINSNLKNFELDTKINGSKQQEKWAEYKKMMKRFQDQNLDLIKDNFDAQKDKDTAKLNATIKSHDNLLKRRYLYTVNFAINNKDSEVAPYLLVSEIYDANLKYLDTVNKVLSPEVKASKYGKELQYLIDKRKADSI